jgi:hypothetical protein
MRNICAALSALVVAALLPLASAAAEDKTPGSGPNPYTDCGIGAALFSETHWAAVTSNIIWDLGTTALTSATGSPQTCSGKKVKTAQLIIDTYENVVEETAAGSGDHLTAMLETYGCDGSAHADIIGAIRPEVAAAVGADDYANLSRVAKAEQYYLIVTGKIEKRFAGNCAA